MGQSEVYDGVESLKSLFDNGVREFVIYEILESKMITPYNSKMSDYKVMVYSPVGKQDIV